MADTGIAARRSALYLLDQVLGEGRLMSELQATGALDALSPADRARAQRLALDTLRGLERADRLLQKHLQKYPPLPVRNALRLGTVELCQGGAAHGVVGTLVEIVSRNRRHGRMKGLVNAVLRKVAAEGPDAWSALRAPRLPKWLRGPLVEAWEAEAVAAMEAAHFAGASLDLSAKTDAEAVARATNGTLLPTGSVRIASPGQVSAMPGYKDGDWWVQDAAAALPSRVLAPKEGEAVLDLCAAPGGKTLQLAAAGAVVTAVDDSAGRSARITENLARTGLRAEVVVRDARKMAGQWTAILLDAPCSATGTIRRHPDLPFAKDGSDFAALIALQTELIDHAWSLLAPGGRLVFCTCSLLPDEGEVQIEEALARHSDMRVDPAALDLPGIDPAWRSAEGGLRLRPDYWADRGGMDGFYIACLRKSA
ncbi:RsmB/NOP family class I SAM-dependent RNA methyltransferase [Sulfitobacter sp. D35]|uniref:RsmB/NOP family class I SAM-dependent RNA methyltransferase n=1 Tax=Sulfitobacter sp. D35 TaxID=3083252 RepID=UPI00296F7EF1|nr:RsmB/NOP family class I SAM-dependent RNA methyltransferase [Sulfitobacter sp. D35]MDW4498388.1 RsmB/NOP family class I SAM-dependent RNA methyltransferase [Sulfitobacter sp. D35]